MIGSKLFDRSLALRPLGLRGPFRDALFSQLEHIRKAVGNSVKWRSWSPRDVPLGVVSQKALYGNMIVPQH